MNEEHKKLLQIKKEQYQLKQKEKAIQEAISCVVQNVDCFNEKYRFVEECEKIKIQKFVSELEFVVPGQLKVKEKCLHKHNNVYLCCLMGDCAVYDIFVFGRYDDFISDYDDWDYISPYLLLIDDDFSHYIYINDYGVDAVRYFALREVPFGSDGNFSEKSLITRTNGDLVNVLGNLVSRTIQMVIKYFDGKVFNKNIKLDIDNDLLNSRDNLLIKIDEKMASYKVNESLEIIFELLRKCNKYIDDTTPWVLAKDEENKDRLETLLYNLLDCIRVSAIFLQAFIPASASKILDILNIKERTFKDINLNLDCYDVGLVKPDNLFERINEE